MNDNKKNNAKLFDEIMNITYAEIFNLINNIDEKIKNTKIDIVNPLQLIIDIVIGRLLFDGFSPKIIQRILNDSLKYAVNNYADNLKKSADTITNVSDKTLVLSNCSENIDKKLLN